jgi:hypothetical protein
MNTIRKEVRDLIRVNESIQSAMVQGDQLTDDEKGLIELCASELIASMSTRQNSSLQPDRCFRESGDGARFLGGGDGQRETTVE